MIIPLFLLACKKEKVEQGQVQPIKAADNLLASQFQHLKIEAMEPVLLGVTSLSLQDAMDARKEAALVHLRDSAWSGLGGSRFYESDEMIVTPSSRSYVYPGAIIKAASIPTDEFKTFFGYATAPIDLHLSFPSSLSFGTIPSPSLSNSRIFLRTALMAPDFSGQQIDDFSQSITMFRRYQEVKLAYGYNVNQRGLFSSTNASFDFNASETLYHTKLMASYTVKNFTYSMPNPTVGQLIDMASITPEVFNGVSPVYVNSVTYGRYGLLVVETNNGGEEMKSAFEKVVKKIFKQTNEAFTQEQITLFSACRVTIYILGSTMGESAIQLLINPNPEAVSNFLSENVGVFTAQDPGVPISYKAKYLKDNSPFKTVFKLDFPNDYYH